MILDRCEIPIVLAPLAGGPSTPELAAAVSNAGGLGFLASGYLSAAELADRRRRLDELTSRPFGVNLFVPGPAGDVARVRQFAAEIESDVSLAGARLGEPRHDDDDWAAKIGYLMDAPADVVSFTFGIPGEDVMAGLRARGTEVWVTVTSPEQARRAAAAGADLLVVQGYEAGGHQGGTRDAPGEETGLIALLQLITARLATPVVAAGGIATGRAIAAVLCLGARAAALGTAFLDGPEAGTAPVHRSALHDDAPTRLTRAFSGRTARGIENGFLRAHSESAPAAYPEVHHLTSPMRKAARQAGLADYVNLWAGQAYPLTSTAPAADLVRDLWEQAQEAIRRLARVGGLPGGRRFCGGDRVCIDRASAWLDVGADEVGSR
jgi:nitronate monooxygenase